MAKLSDIEGIGETYEVKLKEFGIDSIEELLEEANTKAERKTLAEKTGISEKLILNWVNRADLARVKGISTQYADLLEVAGVNTVPQLATRNADNLHAKMIEVNEEKHHVRKVPALSQIQDWIAQAKELPRTLEY